MSKSLTKVISPIELLNTMIDSLGDIKNYGYHEEVIIDGKKCVAIVIGSRRYLVAVENVISSIPWYPNTSDDLSEQVPHTKGQIGNVYSAIPASPVYNYSDYYELDKLTQNIVTAAALKSIDTPIAATAVRGVTLGGLRWNLPNFEVMHYMFKNYDEFFSPTGKYKLGNNVFWLPYSYSGTSSWGFNVYSSPYASVLYDVRTSSSEYFRVLPVSLF